MMEKTYYACFNVKGLETSIFRDIEGLEEGMKHELIRVYNIYADKTNGGVTDLLNNRFDQLYPNYFRNNRDKEWYEMEEYNRFMAEGYQRMVVNDLNRAKISPILKFYVDPEEVVFTGYLRFDPNVTIDFYLKEA